MKDYTGNQDLSLVLNKAPDSGAGSQKGNLIDLVSRLLLKIFIIFHFVLWVNSYFHLKSHIVSAIKE